MQNVSVRISLRYFKDTGKAYACGSLYGSFQAQFPPNSPTCVVYMPDVVRRVLELDLQQELPGLNSGSWLYQGGYILVDCEHGYPVLVLPEHKLGYSPS